MLCQGLKTLDELDEVKEQEQEEEEAKQKAINDARQALEEARAILYLISFSKVANSALTLFSPLFQAMLDFASRTALELLGS